MNTQTQRDREDYAKFLVEIGLTEAQVQRIVHNPHDQSPLPESFGVHLKPSIIHGTGTFVSRDYQPGETIGPARIDAKRTPLGRYTNHSLTPNTAFIPQADGGIVVVAETPIQAGEELTANYRLNRRAATEADSHLKPEMKGTL